MQMRVERDNAPQQRLALSGELTIYEARELQALLLGSLRECESLELDLAGVTELDTAGFQQLYLLRREAATAGKPLRIIAHSAATREVFALLNVEQWPEEGS